MPRSRTRLPRRGALALVLALGLAAPTSGTAGELSAGERQAALGSGRVARAVVERLDREASVPVIVRFEAEGPDPRAALRARGDALLRGLPRADFELKHRYRALRGIAGRVTPEGLRVLLAEPDVRVDVDEGGQGHLAEAVPLSNLDDVQALGFTGAGVTVAVVDSGVDAGQSDIGAGAIVAEQCFCSGGGGCCPAGGTTQSGAGAAADDHGHGTNVSGIVTSDGVVAPVGGAPDAALVAVKVLDANNSFCCSSDVIAALDWILAEQPDVDVVNLSLGTFATFAGDCDDVTATTKLFADAIDALRVQGVLSFVSAGNDGSSTRMSAPACVANAVSLGAVWDANVGSQTFFGCTDDPTAADLVSCWSNRSVSTDLFAPGAPTTSSGLGGGTSTFRGTSQAAPLATACAALLLEQDPGLGASPLERVLKQSPTLVTDPVTSESYPRLDCQDALARAAGLELPLAPWAVGLLSLLLLAAGRRVLRPGCAAGERLH